MIISDAQKFRQLKFFGRNSKKNKNLVSAEMVSGSLMAVCVSVYFMHTTGINYNSVAIYNFFFFFLNIKRWLVVEELFYCCFITCEHDILNSQNENFNFGFDVKKCI